MSARSTDTPVDEASAAERGAVRSRKPDRRRARTRATILAAAVELFARQGVHGTTVEEIAQAAGTSAGTIYFHFGGKDGVAAATVHEALDVAEAQLVEARADRTPLDRLFASFEVYVRFAVEQPLAFQLLSQGAGFTGDEAVDGEGRDATARIQAFLALVTADLAGAVAQGELEAVPPPEALTLLWSTCSGLAGLVARTDALQVTPDVAERTLALGRRVLLEGLRAGAPGPDSRR